MTIEKQFLFQKTDSKIIERIIDDDNVNINHMVLPKGEALPEHYSNSNVYMTILRGQLSIQLNDQDVHMYGAGSLLKIPYQTKMNVKNLHTDTLELIIVKAPAPTN